MDMLNSTTDSSGYPLLRCIIKTISDLGIHFTFKSGGGKATSRKDGWWAKTDVIIGAPSEGNVISERSNIDNSLEPDNSSNQNTVVVENPEAGTDDKTPESITTAETIFEEVCFLQ